jgi:hypothetical protein
MFNPVTSRQKFTREDRELEKYSGRTFSRARREREPTVKERREERLKACSTPPEEVTAARLKISLSGRTTVRRCRVNAAFVQNSGSRSFWRPRLSHDAREYLEVDVGPGAMVEHISTKGRPLERDPITDEVASDVAKEWVTRFKLFYKIDDETAWKPLGEFAANQDAETEVAHELIDPTTGVIGLRARQFRIQPLGMAWRL